MRQRSALHVLLVVNTLLVGALVTERLASSRGVTMLESTALAGPAEAKAVTPRAEEPAGGLVSAAEQRKQILNELQALSRRVERLENAIKGTLQVKVIEMPASSKRSEKE
ncbi:MAG: hypothetical protein SFZ23_05450 [Planctomycetota bacterium]|nr:hypothetical protein [Planctomycetota bacterium]